MRAFDYIIIRAGSAGCVLAHRLSENPKMQVASIMPRNISGNTNATTISIAEKGAAMIIHSA